MKFVIFTAALFIVGLASCSSSEKKKHNVPLLECRMSAVVQCLTDDLVYLVLKCPLGTFESELVKSVNSSL